MSATLSLIDKKTAELQIGEDVVEMEIPRPQQEEAKKDPIPAPNFLLELEHIYGYRGRDTHKSVVYLKQDEELVYFTATIAIIIELQRQKQRFYSQHNGNIRCIALHPKLKIIATGQEERKDSKIGIAAIHLWKVDTLETLKIIGTNDEFQQSVVQVAFSVHDNGEHLCAVSLGNFHVLSVWKWNEGVQVTTPYEFHNPIYDVEFNPKSTTSTELVSFGRGQLFRWTIDDDIVLKPTLIPPNVLNPINSKTKYFTSFTFSSSSHILVGDSDGQIHTFSNNTKRFIHVLNTGSKSGVLCIKQNSNVFAAGNSDGLVTIWNSVTYCQTLSISLNPAHGFARSIIMRDDGYLCIATSKNALLITKDNHKKVKPLVLGHHEDVFGLSCGSTFFVTCGKDKRVIRWDVSKRNSVWLSEVNYETKCCAVSASDTFVAVGCFTGHWVLMDANRGQRLQEGRACYDAIECIGFSPVDTYLAMGSRSGEVYIFLVTEDSLTQQGKLSMPQGPASHLDWAVDSYHIRTSSGDKQIFYWSIPSCRPDDSDYAKYDHYWYTKTCTTAFIAAGVWNKVESLKDIRAVSVNRSEKLVAAGNKCGEVGIFHYPCPTLNTAVVSSGGHGAQVHTVDFQKAASKLISIGGEDMSIFQWKISVDQ